MTLIEQPTATPRGPIDTGDVGNITDIQSYSWIILNWIFQTLSADPYFENFVVKRASTALPVEAWSQVPFLGVYLADESQTPDGAFNMGDIRFSHHVPIGFQYILCNNDPDMLVRDLDRTYWRIYKNLLRSDDFTNRFKTKLPGQTGFNGIERARRMAPRWGLAGSRNETPIGDQRHEWTFQFVTDWAPYGFANLDEMWVKTGLPGPGSTPEEQAAIEQVTVKYEFSQPKTKGGSNAGN